MTSFISFLVKKLLNIASVQAKPQDDSAKTISNSSPMVFADEFVSGRNEEIAKLLQLIRQGHNYPGCEVISVIGMGGVGKTTLVRSVYKDKELDSLFQNRAWITVQRPFSVLSSLRSIARQLYGPNAGREIETVGLEETIDEITRLLCAGKCLIVLDDLTSTADWDLFINYLEKTAVIVVTTRDYKLARHCSRDGNVLKVEFLQDNYAFELFKRKVHLYILKDEIEICPLVITYSTFRKLLSCHEKIVCLQELQEKLKINKNQTHTSRSHLFLLRIICR